MYSDLLNLTPDEVFNRMNLDGLVEPSAETSILHHFKPLTTTRMWNLLKMTTKASGFILDPENAYFLNNDSEVLICFATAGSGKTTIITQKLDRQIRLCGQNPHRICVLSFNTQSVADLKERVNEVFTSNNIASRRFGIYLDVEEVPNIRSLNSLTFNIVDQFKEEFGLFQLNIIKPQDAVTLMSRLLKGYESEVEDYVYNDNQVSQLIALYDLLNETLEPVEQYEKSSYLEGVNVPLEVAKKALSGFRKALQQQSLITHSDTCRMVIEKADAEPKFRALLEEFYDIIVVDEVQDISEATFRLLTYLKGKKNRLWVVGDGDQAIYGFKGARPNNCQLLVDYYKDVADICTLSVNRRCRENILAEARKVLGLMTDRIAPMPRALKEGGEVQHLTYTDKIKCADSLIQSFTNIPKQELRHICLGYRKNFSAYYLVNLCLEYGIPFKIKDDFKPGSDLLSKTIAGVLALLKSPSNSTLLTEHLYKTCVIRKAPPYEKMCEVLHKKLKKNAVYNKELVTDYWDEVKELEDSEYFWEIPLDYFEFHESQRDLLEKQFEELEDLSDKLRNKEYLSELMPQLMKLINFSYWDLMRFQKRFAPEFEEMIIAEFSQDITYAAYRSKKNKQQAIIDDYLAQNMGIQLSSMHSLKGLEYKEVHILELEQGVMPLFRESQISTEDELKQILNEELRVLYVAYTRAKDKLYLYWNSNKESEFIELRDHSVVNTDYNLNLDVDGNSQSVVQAGTYSLDLSIPQNLEVIEQQKEEIINVTELTLDSKYTKREEPELTLDLEDTPNIQEDKLELSLDLKDESKELTDLSLDSECLLEKEHDLSLDCASTNEEDSINPNELQVTPLDCQDIIKAETQQSIVAKAAETVLNKPLQDMPYFNAEEHGSSLEDIDEDDLIEQYHPREDFEDLDNGDALRSILGLLCRDIPIE